MRRLIGFLLLLTIIAACLRAGAAEAAEVTCRSAELAHVEFTNTPEARHGQMCLAVVEQLRELVQLNGNRCEKVWSAKMDTTKGLYWVSCMYLDLSRDASRAEVNVTYFSYNAQPFALSATFLNW